MTSLTANGNLQPMMGAMQALAAVVEKATTKKLVGAAILNLLQSQVCFISHFNAWRGLQSHRVEFSPFLKHVNGRQMPWLGIMLRGPCCRS